MRRLALIAAIALSLSAPLRAAAQPGPGPDTTREDQARILFEEANWYLGKGEYEEALQRYRSAYALVPRAKILLNIATILFELGRAAEAANAFAEYLGRPDAESERLARVRELLAKLDLEVGRLKVRVTGPVGVLRVDGTALEGTDWPRGTVLRVTPGQHSVEVGRDGQTLESRTVVVVAGAVSELAFEVPGATPDAPVVPPVDRPEPPPSGTPDGSPWLYGFVRVDVDVAQAGLVGAPGAAVRLIGSLHGYGNALIGRSAGGEVGLRWEIGAPMVKFRAAVSAPVFFEDGPRFGTRGAVGAVLGERFRVVGELALVHHFTVPEDRYVRTVVLAAFGVEAGL